MAQPRPWRGGKPPSISGFTPLAHAPAPWQQLVPGHPQVRERKQRHDLRRVLLEAPVAHLHIPELLLEHPKRVLNFGSAVEPVGLQDVRYTTVEPLHHAVVSWRSGLGQPMLDAQLLAQLVELVLATGLMLLAGEQAVREFLAVVGQQLAHPDRAGLVQHSLARSS